MIVSDNFVEQLQIPNFATSTFETCHGKMLRECPIHTRISLECQDCWVCWIVCMFTGELVLLLGKGNTKAKKIKRQLHLKQSLTAQLGFGT